jgi:hypothetical protein
VNAEVLALLAALLVYVMGQSVAWTDAPHATRPQAHRDE